MIVEGKKLKSNVFYKLHGSDCYVMKVYGGWVFNVDEDGVTFIPDPIHEATWILSETNSNLQ